MSIPSMTLHRQAWALIALGSGLFLTLTGTTAILWHHILWLTMMPHPHPLIPVLGVTLVATGMAVVAGAGRSKPDIDSSRPIASGRTAFARVSCPFRPLPFGRRPAGTSMPATTSADLPGVSSGLTLPSPDRFGTD